LTAAEPTAAQPVPLEREHHRTDDEPDPRELWRWVGAALRPWTGWILIGIGALLMLLGYLGVSREAILGKQIPYLVSGGLGGVFFCVLGAYFLGTQELRRDSGRLDRLEQMVEELHLALLARPDAPSTARDDTAGPSSNGTRRPARKVVAVTGGETFHRTTCGLVEGKDGEDLTPASARKRGLRPCAVCEPAPATTSA
jgi:hypothetical protein